MSVWARRRQLSIILFFIIILFLVVAILFLTRDTSETCFDGVQNQDELGIDCGGTCVGVCVEEITPPVVLWSRVFRVREGLYDVAFMIENKNKFAVERIPYVIEVYDNENILIKQIKGMTYLNPNQDTIVFVPALDVGYRIPTLSFAEIGTSLDWVRIDFVKPELTIIDREFKTDPHPSIRANIENKTLSDIKDVEFYALVYDKSGNVIAASQSFLEVVPAKSKVEISFTWPENFEDGAVTFDILPRIRATKQL